MIAKGIGKRAFRLMNAVNAALVDSVMVGVASRLKVGPIKKADELGEAFDRLIWDEEFQRAVGRATADEERVRSRFTKAESAFQNVRWCDVSRRTYSPTAQTATQRLLRQLDGLVGRCEELPEVAEVRADAYRYAYIQLAGFLEQSLLIVGRSLVTNRAFAEGLQHGLSYLDRLRRNPTEDEVLRYVARFSERWADDLAAWFAVDNRGDQINALVGIRNGLAHGSSFGGGPRSFADYYIVVLELVEWLVERFETSLS
jgi:hypothetical protein